MSGFTLGQHVRFEHRLHRRPKHWGVDKAQCDKFWTTEIYPGHFTGGGEGIIIGKRTLSNGDTHYGYDGDTTYTPKEHFTAYLIVTSLRSAPVHVLPEHITALEQA